MKRFNRGVSFAPRIMTQHVVVCWSARRTNTTGSSSSASAGSENTPTSSSSSTSPSKSKKPDLTPALKGLRVSAFLGGPDPVAVGAVTAKISDNVFAVAFDRVPSTTRVIEVGSRVYVEIIDPSAPGAVPPAAPPPAAGQAAAQPAPPPVGSWEGPQAGIVARVNGDGTFAVLLDQDDKFLPAVRRSQVVLSEGKPRFLRAESYLRVVDWVRLSGVSRKAELEATSSILYARGWRESRMYLLEAPDVHCLTHLNKSVRMGLLEKAEWEREHHRQRREWSKERLKETEWRYVLTKYSSVLSVCVAFLGASSVFTWNLLRWKREQRDHHLNVAAETLCRKHLKPKLLDRTVHVSRDDTQAVIRRLRELDPAHPRILVLTGPRGSGKSTLCKVAMHEANMSAVYVDVRGADDVPTAILKSLGVTQLAVAGDPMDFIEDACRLAMRNLAKEQAQAKKDGSNGLSRVARRKALAAEKKDQLLHHGHVDNTMTVAHNQQGQNGLLPTSTGTTLATEAAQPIASSNESSAASQHATPSGTSRHAHSLSQHLPTLVLKVRDTTAGVNKVYNEASVLACDRGVCNVVVEVDADRISQANLASLPRLDIHYVPPFTPMEAAQYCQHQVDPLALEAFVQTIGTNSSDLDELISHLHNCKDEDLEKTERTVNYFIDVRLSRAARRVRQLISMEPSLRLGLIALARHEFEDGAHATASGPLLDLLNKIQADQVPTVLREMLFFDAARDVIVFSNKAFHTASQVILC